MLNHFIEGFLMKTIKYKKREKEVLDKIVLLLKEKLNPGLIILFGSRVCEKYSTGSDFDIALDGDKIDVREMRKLKEKLEDRNNTSHIYDKETSEKIFNRIKKNYQTEIAKVIELLNKSLIDALQKED